MSFPVEKKAYCYILLAATGWGFTGFFFNLLADAGLTSFQTALVRMGTGSLFLGVFLLGFQRKSMTIPNLKALLFMVVLGLVSLGGVNILLFKTMRASSVAVSVVLMYTAPIFVLCMSVILFKEQLTRRKIIAVALSVLGCALVSGVFGQKENAISGLALALGIATAICYASYSIFGRYAVRETGPLTITFYSFVFCSLGMLPFVDLGGIGHALHDPAVLLAGLGLGTVSAAFPYLFYIIGLQHIEPSKAVVLSTFEPIVAALMSVFILHEKLTLLQAAGMATVLTSVVLLATARQHSLPAGK